MDRPMRNYSLGMRQRAKLAQAIAHDPELLILDEPFNGLDPIGRNDMNEFLIDWQSKGRSLILASHILHEVEAVKPSFLLISSGRLLASGSPEDVKSILANTPNTVQIRTNKPRELLASVIELPIVESGRIVEPGKNEEPILEIDTKSSAVLLAALPDIIEMRDITISEIQTADNSLKHLFATLMKIHRGETKGGLL
jgi:ABC-2 type transport system ATP-binding protein